MGKHCLSIMSDKNVDTIPIDVTTAVLSNVREKILEHRLISDLAETMMRRGIEMDVMRSEFDAHGHDIVLEAAGVIRHVQLKAMVAGGKRRDVNINVRLRSRPSGCVVWMVYNPATLNAVGFRWFGGHPAEPLPYLGTTVARHTKGNAMGEKIFRNGHRRLGRGEFEILTDLGALADRLFGPARSTATSLVLSQLRERFGIEWPQRVRATLGCPEWKGSSELALMVDGYRILEQFGEVSADNWLAARTALSPGGDHHDDFGELWTTLYLEHRRWRFASPFEPSGEELNRLDRLVAALHEAILAELASPQGA